MGVFLTGAAVTSGPWLLTTMVLVLMRVGAVQSGGSAGMADTERIITVVFAIVIVLSAPIDIVLSRFAADRVYEKRRDQIVGPLRRVLAACLVVFTVVGAGAMLLLGPPARLAVPGTFLATVVGAQWLLLSAAGGLSSPGIILRAFALGAPVSLIAAFGLSRPELLGASGYLYGFGVGQVTTLALLLAGTLSALPENEDDSAKIAPSFREYWLLSAAAFAFHAGIWIDKVIVRVMGGAAMASAYAASAAVAWLSVVPACAYLFVTVETVFERRFTSFYRALHTGASLRDLERLAKELKHEVGRTLRGTAAVQLGVTLLCLLAAPSVVDRLGLSRAGTHTLAWLLIGASAQIVCMSATLLLYYFDFRREAAFAAFTQLAANGLLTALVGAHDGFVGAGYALASAVACAAAIGMLHRRMGQLLERTFQNQPYASEMA